MSTCAVSALPEIFQSRLRAWPRGTVLNNRLGERLSREEIRLRILRRAFREPDFARELQENTRQVFAVVFDECLGLDRYKFLRQVLRYPVLFETQHRLYMEMPACHRGCTLPGALPDVPQPRSECQICEKASPLPAGTRFVMPNVHAFTALTRRKIEALIQKRATWDCRFAEALSAKPFETYVGYASELCSGRLPQYLGGISEIVIVHEQENEMFFLYPTHQRFLLELDC